MIFQTSSIVSIILPPLNITVSNALEITTADSTIAVDETIEIDYTIAPAGTDVTWTSSDNAVATVDENGVVTGVGAGSAVITATGAHGLKDTVTITVEAPEVETPAYDAFVFMVGNVNAYWITYDYQFTTLVPCSFRDGVTYVPFRDLANAAGAKDIKFDADAATVTITNSYDMTFVLKMGEKACTYTYAGQTYDSSLNYAPKFIDSVCCLPVRDVANITFASVEYVETEDGQGYVIVSKTALTDAEKFDCVEIFNSKVK